LDNDEWDVYLVSEVNLVVEECIPLKDDIPARQKYMSDREVMTIAIMQVSGLTECCQDVAHVSLSRYSTVSPLKTGMTNNKVMLWRGRMNSLHNGAMRMALLSIEINCL
jgi:hypothetical protein